MEKAIRRPTKDTTATTPYNIQIGSVVCWRWQPSTFLIYIGHIFLSCISAYNEFNPADGWLMDRLDIYTVHHSDRNRGWLSLNYNMGGWSTVYFLKI
jgi:hypothetical protein